MGSKDDMLDAHHDTLTKSIYTSRIHSYKYNCTPSTPVGPLYELLQSHCYNHVICMLSFLLFFGKGHYGSRINITTTNTMILTIQEPELVNKDKKVNIVAEVYELLSCNCVFLPRRRLTVDELDYMFC